MFEKYQNWIAEEQRATLNLEFHLFILLNRISVPILRESKE
jgi:hypothetical protein